MPQPEIELLIRQLAPYRTRARALDLLDQHGPVAVEPLCRALGDGDVVTRRFVAEALGKIGDARAVETLCRALGHPNMDDRVYAGRALAKIGDAAVEPLCLALGHQNEYVRNSAASALRKIGDIY